ncbi:hypothetical protein ACFRCX_14025 [Streptomyces sp. NPDC056652]|uniref:hypothetical protein n=1 Tax=Streptomyces sp. NPDC056652 TaxID=3345893 RepID=UPI0036AD481E
MLPGAASLHIHLLINYFFTASSSLVLGALGGFLISRVLDRASARTPRPVTNPRRRL